MLIKIQCACFSQKKKKIQCTCTICNTVVLVLHLRISIINLLFFNCSYNPTVPLPPPKKKKKQGKMRNLIISSLYKKNQSKPTSYKAFGMN